MSEDSRETCRSWVAMVASSIIQSVSAAPTTAMSLFVVEWMLHFGASRGIVAMVVSGNIGLLLAVGPIANGLASRFGYRLVVMIGSIVATIGLMLSSQATSVIWLIITYSCITGIGYSLMYLPSVTAIPFVFDKNVIIAASGSTIPLSMCILIYPYLYRYLIKEYGWRTTMVVMACLTAQGTVAGALLPARPLLQRQPASSSPTQTNTKKKCPSFLDFRCLCLYATSALGIVSNGVLFSLAADYVLTSGFTIEKATFALFLFGLGSLIARISVMLIGRLMKSKSLHMQTASIAMRTFFCFILPFAKSFIPIAIAMVAFGLGWGIHMALFTTTANELVNKKNLARVIGIISLIFGFVMFLSPIIASWLLDITDSFNIPWIASGVCGIIAILFSIPLFMKKQEHVILDDGITIVDIPLTQPEDLKETDA